MELAIKTVIKISNYISLINNFILYIFLNGRCHNFKQLPKEKSYNQAYKPANGAITCEIETQNKAPIALVFRPNYKSTKI